MAKVDSECYFGRHKFVAGFCTRPGCAVDQNNIVYISGRRWFRRSSGTTYHSVTVTLPDGTELRCPQAGGYGNQFEQTAVALLQEHFGDPRNGVISLHPYLQAKGYYPSITVADVPRERDL